MIFIKMSKKDLEIWFLEAENDLKAADLLYKAKRYNIAAFHYVQAAEKAIKSLLYYHNLQPWGHSLSDLIAQYEKLGNLVDNEIKIRCKKLEKHYITSRYPDSLPNISPFQAYNKFNTKEIKQMSNFIIEFVIQEKEKLI